MNLIRMVRARTAQSLHGDGPGGPESSPPPRPSTEGMADRGDLPPAFPVGPISYSQQRHPEARSASTARHVGDPPTEGPLVPYTQERCRCPRTARTVHLDGCPQVAAWEAWDALLARLTGRGRAGP